MFIYKITCTKNKKIYIGQTIQDPGQRWRQHLSSLNNNKHSNPPLQHSFNKYGEKNFQFKILKQAETIEELNELEIKYIKKYACLTPKGFNITKGGLNYEVTLESRIKQSKKNLKKAFNVYDANTGKKLGKYDNTIECSIEFNIPSTNIIPCLEGRYHSMYGLVFSYLGEKKPTGEKLRELYSNIVSESVKGKVRKFFIYNGTTGKPLREFVSQTFCAKIYGLHSTGILKCLRKEQYSHKGYTFAYSDEPKPLTINEAEKLLIVKRARAQGQKPFYVYEVETGDFVGEFNAQVLCAKALKIKNSSQISMTLNSQKLKSAYGYFFIYKHSKRKIKIGKEYEKYRSRNFAKSQGQRKFFCYSYETGTLISEWRSQTLCSEKLEVSRRAIGRCLEGKISKVKGYIFKYKKVTKLKIYGKELARITKENKAKKISKTRGDGKVFNVYDKNTGKKISEFINKSEASRFIGCSDTEIRKCLQGKQLYTGDYVLAYKSSKKPLYGKKLTKAIEARRPKKPIEVYDRKTNEFIGRYDSITECSKAIGLSRSRISMCISKKLPTRKYILELGDSE